MPRAAAISMSAAPDWQWNFNCRRLDRQFTNLPRSFVRLIPWMAATAIMLPLAAFAQQPPQPAPQPVPQQQPAPVQPSNDWEKLPRMQLERQFAGPLKDTIIQRWRDPTDGAICYIYLPISAPHSPPTQPGFVQYGGNIIGTLSCYATPAATPPPPTRSPAAQKK